MKTATTLLALACLALAASRPPSDYAEAPDAAKPWQIGPVIKGRSSSPGMPRAVADGFDFPRCAEPVSPDVPSVHYVTRASGRIGGTMTLSYSIEASPDAVFVAADGGSAGRIALYFQRRGDSWSGRGKYAAYRWWSSNRPTLKPGTWSLSVPLDRAAWIPVTSSRHATAAAFGKAAAKAARVGFTFGGAGNAGHGVCLTSGTASFRVVSFAVE